MWTTIVLILVSGFALFGLAAVTYSAYLFASTVINLQAAVLREMRSHPASTPGKPDNSEVASPLSFRPDDPRVAPSDGDFVGQSDEVEFVNEMAENLRRQGMTSEELDAFVRQAVGSDIGSKE